MCLDVRNPVDAFGIPVPGGGAFCLLPKVAIFGYQPLSFCLEVRGIKLRQTLLYSTALAAIKKMQC